MDKKNLNGTIVQFLIGILIAMVIVEGPILLDSYTAAKAKIEEREPKGKNVARVALSDKVNLYTDYQVFNDADVNEIHVKLLCLTTYSGKKFYYLHLFTLNNSHAIKRILKGDQMHFRLSNNDTIIISSAKAGEINRYGYGRRSIARARQHVYYPISSGQLEAICSNQVEEFIIMTSRTGVVHKARKAFSADLRKRYDLLQNYLNAKTSEEPKLESTTSNDPNVVRFGRTDYVHINDSMYIRLSGYRDKDGDESIILHTLWLSDTTCTHYVPAQNRLVISLDNDMQIDLCTVSNGYIRRSKSNRYNRQFITCKISPQQLDLMCMHEIKDIIIETKKGKYIEYARPGVSSDLKKRYKLLLKHLHS